MALVVIEEKDLENLILNVVTQCIAPLKDGFTKLSNQVSNNDTELSPNEVFRKYGISHFIQKNMRDRGGLPHERRGQRTIVYKESELREYFNQTGKGNIK